MMWKFRRIAVIFLVFSGPLLWCSCAKDETKAPQTDKNRNHARQVMIPLALPLPKFEGTPNDEVHVTPLEAATASPRPPFYAPAGTVNLALGKPVTGSESDPVLGTLAMITDGDKEAVDDALVELGPSLQYVTVDLGEPCRLYAIVLWHFHSRPRAYYDVIVRVSNDAAFDTEVTTLFNNDGDNSAGFGAGADLHYIDSYQGKLIDARGAIARYVRFYSNGNTDNQLNHYLEAEVYGVATP